MLYPNLVYKQKLQRKQESSPAFSSGQLYGWALSVLNVKCLSRANSIFTGSHTNGTARAGSGVDPPPSTLGLWGQTDGLGMAWLLLNIKPKHLTYPNIPTKHILTQSEDPPVIAGSDRLLVSDALSGIRFVLCNCRPPLNIMEIIYLKANDLTSIFLENLSTFKCILLC